MPYEFVVDRTQKLVRLKGTGTITYEIVTNINEHMQRAGVISYDKVVDLIECEFHFQEPQPMQLAGWISGYASTMVPGAVAYAARSDVTIDALKRYINLTKQWRPARIFSTVSRAEKWLLKRRAAANPAARV